MEPRQHYVWMAMTISEKRMAAADGRFELPSSPELEGIRVQAATLKEQVGKLLSPPEVDLLLAGLYGQNDYFSAALETLTRPQKQAPFHTLILRARKNMEVMMGLRKDWGE